LGFGNADGRKQQRRHANGNANNPHHARRRQPAPEQERLRIEKFSAGAAHVDLLSLPSIARTLILQARNIHTLRASGRQARAPFAPVRDPADRPA
jgi:hypothetical protein